MKEMTSPLAHKGWIFGRTIDLAIFPGTTLVALFLCFFATETYSVTLLRYLIFEQAHVYFFPFLTFGSKSQMQTRGKYLILLLIVPIIALYILSITIGDAKTRLIVVVISIYHFIRQQAAWFLISAAKAKTRGSMERFIVPLFC